MLKPIYYGRTIDKDYFEKKFSGLYSEKGRPAHSIRLMTSLLIVKAMHNLLDEMLVEEHWEMNAYFQYFGGDFQRKIREDVILGIQILFQS